MSDARRCLTGCTLLWRHFEARQLISVVCSAEHMVELDRNYTTEGKNVTVSHDFFQVS